MAKFIIKLNNNVVDHVELGQGDMKIGRKAGCEIHLDNLSVSGEHANIFTIGEDSFVQDLGSTNGTYVNNKKITKHHLKDGDSIAVGKYTLVYLSEAVRETSPFAKTVAITGPASDTRPAPAAKPPAAAAKAPGPAALITLSGGGTPQAHRTHQDRHQSRQGRQAQRQHHAHAGRLSPRGRRRRGAQAQRPGDLRQERQAAQRRHHRGRRYAPAVPPEITMSRICPSARTRRRPMPQKCGCGYAFDTGSDETTVSPTVEVVRQAVTEDEYKHLYEARLEQTQQDLKTLITRHGTSGWTPSQRNEIEAAIKRVDLAKTELAAQVQRSADAKRHLEAAKNRVEIRKISTLANKKI